MVNRLDGQLAWWSIGSMVNRLDGQLARWLIGLMVNRSDSERQRGFINGQTDRQTNRRTYTTKKDCCNLWLKHPPPICDWIVLYCNHSNIQVSSNPTLPITHLENTNILAILLYSDYTKNNLYFSNFSSCTFLQQLCIILPPTFLTTEMKNGN